MNDNSGGPNLGSGPNLGGSSNTGGPSLGTPSVSSSKVDEKKPLISDLSKNQEISKKKTKVSIDKHEMVRRFGVSRRKIAEVLRTFMSREMKIKVNLSKDNQLYRKNIKELMQGHLSYLEEMINDIKEGNDPLSQELMQQDVENRASTMAFESLMEVITEEIDKLENENAEVLPAIIDEIKRYNDPRIETRICFWILLYSGLQMREIRDKEGNSLDIALSVIIRYKPVLRRAMGVFLLFTDHLIRQLDPFPVDYSRIKLVIGPTKTGYNMASWIKYRYDTNSQKKINYLSFIDYYARSFGIIPGNAPNIDNGPKQGYTNWLNRALIALEQDLRNSPFIMANKRGDTLEGMLVGMKLEIEEELTKREYDEKGRLTNQPPYGEGALKFISWLFETAFNRFNTTNFVANKEISMQIEMFDFLLGAVKWENEYGERLILDWLTPEEEDGIE